MTQVRMRHRTSSHLRLPTSSMPPETFRARRLVDGREDGECERDGRKANVIENGWMGRKLKVIEEMV